MWTAVDSTSKIYGSGVVLLENEITKLIALQETIPNMQRAETLQEK